jgi:hypothetical protein
MMKGELATNIWSRALQADIRYLGKVSQLAALAFQELALAFTNVAQQLAAPTRLLRQQQELPVQAPDLPPTRAAIVLEAEAGRSAVGFFVVENKLPREISTTVEVGPLTAPDGRQIRSILRFDPGMITLAAQQQIVAKVTARISRRLRPGARYEGEIRVPGIFGARIPIVIRRKSLLVLPSARERRSMAEEKKSMCARQPRAKS